MKNNGIITMWVLVFGTVFIIMLTGLIGFLIFEIKQNQKTINQNLALHIASAGINYARWHLAHDEENFTFSDTYDYKDPEGAVIGQYQLSITTPSGCDPGTKITSTGWSAKDQDEKREILVTYSKPSLAKYAFLTNSNVWFGEEEELKGPFHSNSGIRMDGQQNSLSTSAKETYICGPEHGCSPPQEKPGIWGKGDGEERGLWQFPTSNVDFESVVQDLATLKQLAEDSGVFLKRTNKLGYHIKFKIDGSFDVYKVKKLKSNVWGYDMNTWTYESNSIDKETFYQNFSIPNNCAPIFVEDNVWVEGDVNGRTTVVAARLPDIPSDNAKIIIPASINYVDENSVLGLIGQKDILIPLYSPNDLEIKAAMLAQKGHIFRYYYPNWGYEPYRTYAIRDYIETYGSIITNTIWTFTWVNAAGTVVSGYKETEMSYNPQLTYSPPPYFPVTGEYEIVSWEEID